MKTLEGESMMERVHRYMKQEKTMFEKSKMTKEINQQEHLTQKEIRQNMQRKQA